MCFINASTCTLRLTLGFALCEREMRVSFTRASRIISFIFILQGFCAISDAFRFQAASKIKGISCGHLVFLKRLQISC